MLNQQQGKRTITNASSSRNSLTKSSTTSSTNLVNSSTTSTTAYNSRTTTTASHQHNGTTAQTIPSSSNRIAPTTTTTMNFGRPVPATYQKTTMDTNTITTINHIPTVASTKSNFVVPPKVCF